MDFDLKNPDTHANGEAALVFRDLRVSDPLYWHDEDDGPGFWCVTRYEDVVLVSRDPERFGSALELGGIHIDDSRSFEANAGVNMITADPPRHRSMRRVVSPAFNPRRVDHLETLIAAHIDELFDALEDKPGFDFVEAIAAPLPMYVLATLLGAQPEYRERMIEWSDQLIGYDDPEIRASEQDMRDSLQRMAMFALSLWMHGARDDGNSIVSMLARSRDMNGNAMTMRDFVATFILMIVAGNETTRNAISGGLLALAEFPEQKQALCEDPGLMSNAVAEIVRWVSPVIYMRRTAQEDVKLRGKRIRAGDKVVLWYTSANRDEEVFTDPDRFDVRRDGPSHLGFGSGEHFCLGSRVAELELKLLFTRLLQRFPSIEIDGRVERMRSNFINGIKRMPVATDTRGSSGAPV